ncbi:vegetative incompatibility protein HET-E-1, partial [Colletotrichum tofieldiae]
FKQQLATSRDFCENPKDCKERLEAVITQLDLGQNYPSFKRFKPSLKWPFTSKEITQTVEDLRLWRASFLVAMQVDQLSWPVIHGFESSRAIFLSVYLRHTEILQCGLTTNWTSSQISQLLKGHPSTAMTTNQSKYVIQIQGRAYFAKSSVVSTTLMALTGKIHTNSGTQVYKSRLLVKLLARTATITSIMVRVFLTSRSELQVTLGFRDIPEESHQDVLLQNIPNAFIEHDIR